MTEIQQVSANASRMLSYGPAPNRVKPAVPRSSVQSSVDVPETFGPKNIQNAVLIPDNRIPKVEEIKKMIQSNGYPFKSDVYKAVARIVEGDFN
jgi:hypothetical protein